MSSNFKTPLSVYVLYDKDNTKGSETYEKIYHLLCRNSSRPFEDGLDIPVFFRTDMANQIPPIDINFSNKTIAILLVDDNMYCNTIWDEYIKELLVKEDNGALKIFAVKLSKYAFDINPLLQEEQFICLKNENIETDWHEFQIRLYDNILRYLKSYKVGQKLKLFISHSKKDKDHLGESTAISLRDYLRSDTKLDSFFDVNDILDGHQFAQQIQSGIASSLLVIIESDTYSEREWCRIEAISGKKNNVPSILVNVLNGVSSRTFPYLGNMPKIRFNGKWDDVIILLLRTALDQYYEKEYLEQLVMKCDLQNTSILPVPPELMNLINIEDNIKSILYPEPPLGREELEVLNKNGKITSFVTPSQLYSNMNKIQDKKIAISISETPEALTKGIGKAMFDDLSVEIARHLLVTGAKLVYGGDLRIGGFTKLLCDLSCQYGIKEKSDPSTIYFTNYFAWPIFNRLSKSDIAEFKYDRVEIVKIEIPKGVGEEDKGKFFEPTTPSKMFLWANSLSIMRKEMEENVNARIVLGGKIVNFKGRMAGIFEEAICAIQKKHPIYLLGGFGGASAQIVKLMKGETTAEKLFEEAKTNEDYKKLIEYCQMSCLPTINYDELKKFENKDYQVLRNGLDKDENEILFNSINIPEIISLILMGINKAFNY